MATEKQPHLYTPLEEKINIQTHAFGFVLSIVATILLVIKAVNFGSIWHVSSFAVFGFSLMNLYLASTLYHRSTIPEKRNRWQIIDHASIYILIAGTYTPFTLVTLHGTVGWIIFGVVWGSAIVGVTLKMNFTGRYDVLSTIMYVIMGWIVIFAIKPLYHNLPLGGLIWLFGGGISYTTGAILYSIKKIKFNHAIFHVLVLIGSFCHFIAVYYYVL